MIIMGWFKNKRICAKYGLKFGCSLRDVKLTVFEHNAKRTKITVEPKKNPIRLKKGKLIYIKKGIKAQVNTNLTFIGGNKVRLTGATITFNH